MIPAIKLSIATLSEKVRGATHDDRRHIEHELSELLALAKAEQPIIPYIVGCSPTTRDIFRLYMRLAEEAQKVVLETLIAGGKSERGHGVRFAPERTDEHLEHAEFHVTRTSATKEYYGSPSKCLDDDTELPHLYHAITRGLLAVVNEELTQPAE